jgi:glutamate decarboxylase
VALTTLFCSILADGSRQLIDAVKAIIIPYIRAADEAAPDKSSGDASIDEEKTQSVLVNPQSPGDLVTRLSFSLPDREQEGRKALLRTIGNILDNSVNTWDQGFLDKLYASTNAVSFRQPTMPRLSP